MPQIIDVDSKLLEKNSQYWERRYKDGETDLVHFEGSSNSLEGNYNYK